MIDDFVLLERKVNALEKENLFLKKRGMGKKINPNILALFVVCGTSIILTVIVSIVKLFCLLV